MTCCEQTDEEKNAHHGQCFWAVLLVCQVLAAIASIAIGNGLGRVIASGAEYMCDDRNPCTKYMKLSAAGCVFVVWLYWASNRLMHQRAVRRRDE